MFCHLLLPFNGSIKLACYYGFFNVPVKASMITQTICVHTTLLEPMTGIAPKISLLGSSELEEQWRYYKGVVIQV